VASTQALARVKCTSVALDLSPSFLLLRFEHGWPINERASRISDSRYRRRRRRRRRRRTIELFLRPVVAQGARNTSVSSRVRYIPIIIVIKRDIAARSLARFGINSISLGARWPLCEIRRVSAHETSRMTRVI